MFDGLAFAGLQTDQFLGKAVVGPFGIAVFFADEGGEAGAVDFRGFGFHIQKHVVANFDGAFHGFGGGVHLAQVFDGDIHGGLVWSLPFIVHADGVVIAEVYFRGERNPEDELGRVHAFDVFERAGGTRVYIRFFEDVGIFRVDEQVDGLFGDGGFAVHVDDDVIRRLAGAESRNAAAGRDLGRGAFFIGFHLLRVYVHDQLDGMIFLILFFDVQRFLRNPKALDDLKVFDK